MANPQCTVNGLLTTNGVDVPALNLVTIQLADIAGVNSWSITCLSTDDGHSSAAINLSMSINSVTKTCTYPSTEQGSALIFESIVNGGVDANGRVDQSLRTRFGVYVLSSGLRLAAFDETTEGSSSFGWTKKFNDVIRLAAGSLLPTDTAATPDTVALRDASANCSFNLVNATQVYGDAGTLILAADGNSGITIDGALSGLIICGNPVKAPSYQLGIDTPVTRKVPMIWHGHLIAGALSWIPTNSGKPNCIFTNSGALLFIQLDLPNGVRLDSVSVKLKGGGSFVNPLPQFAPVVTVIEEDTATLVQNQLGQLMDPAGVAPGGTPTAYRDTAHNVTPVINGGAGTVIDSTAKTYLLQVEPESGTDSVAGMVVYGVSVTYTRLDGSEVGND